MEAQPEIAYAAYTESCTFMLDADGICRWVAAAGQRRGDEGASGGHFASGPLPAHAERCIGAQYVASIDARAEGALIQGPQPGTPMLFARIEANGRIALVRTGPLVRFEEKGDSGVRKAPESDTSPNLPEDLVDSFVANHAIAINVPRPPIFRDDDESTMPYAPSKRTIAQALPSEPPPRAALGMPRIPSPPPVPTFREAPPFAESPTIPLPRMTRLPPARAEMRAETNELQVDVDVDEDEVTEKTTMRASTPPRPSGMVPRQPRPSLPPRTSSVPQITVAPREPARRESAPAREARRESAPAREVARPAPAREAVAPRMTNPPRAPAAPRAPTPPRVAPARPSIHSSQPSWELDLRSGSPRVRRAR